MLKEVRYFQVRKVLSSALFYELSNADTQFPFDVEFGWIPFFYQITISRALAQLHDKMSTQHPQLTANEKKNAEGLSCLKMADPRAASMVFGRVV